jgi:hypothetical protein
METNRISYKHITVWTDDQFPDLIFGIYSPKLEIDLKIAQELIENRLEFCHGEEKYMLIDFTNVKSVTKEARDFMNSPDGGLRGVLGGAFVSNNVVATLFINLYLKVSHPVIPAKFFTNRNEALKWLIGIRNENRILSVL